MSQYVDIAEAAAMLHLTEEALGQLARAGQIPATWLPSRQSFVFRTVDLDTYRTRQP
jgi:hypothetical protein